MPGQQHRAPTAPNSNASVGSAWSRDSIRSRFDNAPDRARHGDGGILPRPPREERLDCHLSAGTHRVPSPSQLKQACPSFAGRVAALPSSAMSGATRKLSSPSLEFAETPACYDLPNSCFPPRDPVADAQSGGTAAFRSTARGDVTWACDWSSKADGGGQHGKIFVKTRGRYMKADGSGDPAALGPGTHDRAPIVLRGQVTGVRRQWPQDRGAVSSLRGHSHQPQPRHYYPSNAHAHAHAHAWERGGRPHTAAATAACQRGGPGGFGGGFGRRPGTAGPLTGGGGGGGGGGGLASTQRASTAPARPSTAAASDHEREAAAAAATRGGGYLGTAAISAAVAHAVAAAGRMSAQRRPETPAAEAAARPGSGGGGGAFSSSSAGFAATGGSSSPCGFGRSGGGFAASSGCAVAANQSPLLLSASLARSLKRGGAAGAPRRVGPPRLGIEGLSDAPPPGWAFGRKAGAAALAAGSSSSSALAASRKLRGSSSRGSPSRPATPLGAGGGDGDLAGDAERVRALPFGGMMGPAYM